MKKTDDTIEKRAKDLNRHFIKEDSQITNNIKRCSASSTIRRANQNQREGDFPSGPVIKHPPCNAGDSGLIPCQGTRTPHAMEQLKAPVPQLESSCTAAKYSTCHDEDPTQPNTFILIIKR